MSVERTCRDDDRCQQAIDYGVEGTASCSPRCVMPRVAQVQSWEYRWLNPGDRTDIHPGDADWKPVAINTRLQTIEQKVAELRAYRYNNRPIYEVRPLFSIPGADEVPPGWTAVLAPTTPAGAEPDWEECIRQAELATGVKVERHTMSIVIREVRRWLVQRAGFAGHEHDSLRDNIGQAISNVLTGWASKIDDALTVDVHDARVIDEIADATLPLIADLTYPMEAVEAAIFDLTADEGEDSGLAQLQQMAHSLHRRQPGKTFWDLLDILEGADTGVPPDATPAELWAEIYRLRAQQAAPPETLDPVEGDILPKMGEEVLIHLASQDEWVPHTVVGYYVWPDLRGDSALCRVFVRVRHASGSLNARLLRDVRKLDGRAFYEPRVLPLEGASRIEFGGNPGTLSRTRRCRVCGRKDFASDHTAAFHTCEPVADPCPGCPPGEQCRTPACGRLKKGASA